MAGKYIQETDEREKAWPWSPRALSCASTVVVVPLYSKKLHIFVRLESTSWVTSLTILVFSLGLMVVNHFASRVLPCRLTSSTKLIYSGWPPSKETTSQLLPTGCHSS